MGFSFYRSMGKSVPGLEFFVLKILLKVSSIQLLPSPSSTHDFVDLEILLGGGFF